MAVSETAKLIVDLSLKGNFARQMNASTKALDKFSKGESRAFKAGAQIGTGIKNAGKIAAVGIAALTSQVALGLDSLIELEKAEAQTAAVLKSTGGAAKISAAEVTRLAEKYEALNATIGDEFIRAGENMLLTFTNIRGKAFEPALQAILNMNTALGKGPEGLTSTAIQVGKALNDPAKGITALRRVGVAFTESQVKKIKALQKEGKLYEAQKIILAELNKEFGGSFAAQGDTTAGKVAKFTDAIDDLQRSLATALLPTVSNVADALSEFLADPAVVRGAEELGAEIGKMFSKENIQSGITALRGIFNTAREVAPVVAAAAKTMGGFISAAVRAFQSLPPEIQNLAIAGFAVNKLTGGLVTNIGGGLLSAVLRQLKSAVVTVHGGVVNVSGPGGVPAAGGASNVKTLAAVLGPAIAVAIGSQFVTDEVNKGTGAKFTNPFAGGIGGNIVSGLNNLSEVIRNWKPPVSKPADREHEGSGMRRDAAAAAANKTTTAVEKMRGGLAKDLGGLQQSALDAKIIASAQARTALETKASNSAGFIATSLAAKRAGDTNASATRVSVGSAATRITSAIRANRPITNVSVHVNATTVTKSYTVVTRYGPSGGSATKDSRYGSVPI